MSFRISFSQRGTQSKNNVRRQSLNYLHQHSVRKSSGTVHNQVDMIRQNFQNNNFYLVSLACFFNWNFAKNFYFFFSHHVIPIFWSYLNCFQIIPDGILIMFIIFYFYFCRASAQSYLCFHFFSARQRGARAAKFI